MCVWLCATVGSQTLQKVAESLNSKRLIHVHVHVMILFCPLVSKTTEQELHFSAGKFVWIEIAKLDSLLLALQWRSWTVDDLGLLFLAAILETPCPAGQFPLMFQYFDDVRLIKTFIILISS